MTIDTLELQVAHHLFLLVLQIYVMSFLAKVLLAVPKIDHKNFVLLFSKSHHEIIGLHVIIDQSFGVNPLKSIEQLVCNQKNCLQGKHSLTVF